MTTATEEKLADATVAPNEGTEWIPVHEICRNPAQPRKHFDPEELGELAQSLQEHGQLQPIAVRKVETTDPDDDTHLCGYVMILGERRWRAAQANGWAAIEAKVYEGLSEAEAHVLALVENIDRAALNPIEEAEGFADLKNKYGWTQERIAERFKRSRGRVSNIVRLLDLPADVQGLVRSGALSSKHGEALLAYKKYPKVCSAIADIAVADDLTVDKLGSGIPREWELARNGLIERVDLEEFEIPIYDAKTLTTVREMVKDIPGIHIEIEDYFDGDEDDPNKPDPETEFGVCGVWALDPEAFKKWAAERKGQLAAAEKEALEQAAGKPKKKSKKEPAATATEEPAGPVLLSKLSNNSYRLLNDVPVALRKEIPAESIVEAIDWQEKKVKICTDVALVDRLKRRAVIEKNRKARAELDAAWAGAVETIKSIDQVRAVDVAVLAAWCVPWAHALGTGLRALGLKGGASNLAKLTPVEIIQVVLLTKLEGEYTGAHRNASPIPNDLKAYAGDIKKRLQQMESVADEPSKKKGSKKPRKGKAGKS